MIRQVLVAGALLGAIQAAHSQPVYEPDMQPLEACGDFPGWTPTGAAICAREATREADRRIAELMNEAGSPGLGLHRADLSAAQASWRRYRDLHCGLFDRGERPRGSQAPADIAFCRLDRSLRREAELKLLIYLMGPR